MTSESAPVLLYHFPASLCSQKVRLALEEKGVRWRSRVVDIGPRMENYDAWYARTNPGLVVPTLQHGEEIVTDSARILRYVDAQLEGPSLTPTSPEARRSMEGWIELGDALCLRELSYARMPRLAAPLRRLQFDLRRRTLRARAAAHPELAELYENKLRDVDAWQAAVERPGAVEALKEETASRLDALEARLAGRSWLVGEIYSLADVMWTALLARLAFLGDDRLWKGGARPGVAAYLGRARARPSFEAADLWERQRPLRMLSLLLRSAGRRLRSR